MLPIVTCRHHNVQWLDSHTCRCLECGKRGEWAEQGFSIWMRTEPEADQPRGIRLSKLSAVSTKNAVLRSRQLRRPAQRVA